MKFILVVLAALSSLSMAQSKWHLQNPWPTSSILYSVCPISDEKVFITGLSVVLSSEDGGKTWQTQKLPSEGMGSKVFFLNPSAGWIVNPDKLSRTNDGGKSWQEFPTGIDMSKHSFSDLTFTDEKTGFLVINPMLSSSQFITANPGKLFKTEDGGAIWKEMPLKAEGELNYVSIEDLQHIKVSGTDSVTLNFRRTCLYSSSDSGKTWVKMQPPRSGELEGRPVFFTPDKGWLGQYKTYDGGKSWKEKAPSGNIFFADSLKAWAVKDTLLYFTSDGGENWNLTFQGEQYITFSAVSFFNEKTGWISTFRGTIYKTQDGGKSWEKVNRGCNKGLEDIDFVDKDNGWAVGSSGTILHTTDGGVNWIEQNSGVKTLLNNVQFRNKNLGWVTGYSLVLKTKDGGNTWSKYDIPDYHWIQDMQFMDDNVGWMVSGDGFIIKTTDGGISWNLVLSNPAVFYSSVSFTDSLNGWVSGSGTLLHTIDGGKTWQESRTQYMGSMHKVRFIDKDHGWITEADDVEFYRTKDGGMSWERIPPENYVFELPGIGDFFFFDKNNGWACSFMFSEISRTTDGGWTWSKHEVLPSPIMSLDFLDENNGYAAGLNGGIFHYVDNTSEVKAECGNEDGSQTPAVYPNPFNNSARIQFTLTRQQQVKVTIYNVMGEKVKNFPEAIYQKGTHSVQFDASAYPSGIYLIMIQAEEFSKAIKCLQIK